MKWYRLCLNLVICVHRLSLAQPSLSLSSSLSRQNWHIGFIQLLLLVVSLINLMANMNVFDESRKSVKAKNTSIEINLCSFNVRA